MTRHLARSGASVACIHALLLSGAHATSVLHVDDDAQCGGNGLTWATAFNFLQDALEAASAGGILEIRVAQGVYQPDRDCDHPQGSGDRAATFTLIDEVVLSGGFAGIGAPDPNARDIDVYVTVLSGDLAGDDRPGHQNNEENSHHVVTVPQPDPTAPGVFFIDGFTIRAGNSVGAPLMEDSGGGLRCEPESSPHISRCRIVGNMAEYGGGIACGHPDLPGQILGDPRVTDCSLVENWAMHGGGGAYFGWEVDPIIFGCLIESNEVFDGAGGGILFDFENLSTVRACRIRANSATWGGGLFDDFGFPDIDNCVISGNSADEEGGGLAWRDSIALLTNNTITGNTAARGGAIHSLLSICFGTDQMVSNCILWGNTATAGFGPEITLEGDPLFGCGMLSVAFADVEEGESGVHITGMYSLTWGPGNIESDPRFVDPTGENLRLQPTSPCIDAGDATAVLASVIGDLDGNPRIIDDPATGNTGIGDPCFVDMGAYEFQPPCRADVGTPPDGVIDVLDLLAVLMAWGATNVPEDINCDGVVNSADLQILLLDWGPCGP